MRIIVAETAGFCWGVQRALDIALDTSRSNGNKVYTYGPLIHNNQVVAELEKRRIYALDGEPESASDGKLVVRAHGIRPDVMTDIKKRHGDVVDATCPLVMKVHRKIIKHQLEGFRIYIMGDPKHPEVIGLLGAANDEAIVIPPNPAEVAKLGDDLGRVCLVSQTTQNDDVFARVAAALKPKCSELKIANTICEPTRSHQMETIDMAARVDTVVVVGGRHSANTRHLAELARELGPRVVHVETEAELAVTDFKDAGVVGVTAGASTPQWMIQRVVDKLESFNGRTGVLSRIGKAISGFFVTTHLFTTLSFSLILLGVYALSGIPVPAGIFAATVLLVFGLHCINEFSEEAGFDRKSHLSPLAFERFRRSMMGLAVLGVTGSLLLTFSMWNTAQVGGAFVALLSASALGGIVYGWKLVPQKYTTRFGFSSIKDLPGSKDLTIAGGWTVLLAGLPLVSGLTVNLTLYAITMGFTFLMVYRRTAIQVLRDVQGDRIVGMESSFKFMGKGLSKKVHIGIDVMTILLCLPVVYYSPFLLGFLVALAALLGLALSVLYHIRRMPSGNTGLFFLDCQFVLPGLVGVFLALLGMTA